jgi:hypothetical protein
MSWEDKYCFTDSKLLCQYHLRDDPDFKLFEDVKLKGNPFFHNFYELDDGTGLYVFDLSSLNEDFWKITTGKYSTVSETTKNKILEFFKGHTTHSVYIESYLEPEKFYGMYSEILNVKLKYFKECGELCNKPELELETLKIGAKIMNSKINELNLPTETNQ